MKRFLLIAVTAIAGVLVAAWFMHEGATIAALFISSGTAATVRIIQKKVPQ